VSTIDVIRDAAGAQREQLLALVRRRAGNKVDAEEVVQVALQRALERAGQLREAGRAEAWLGRVVRNVLIDELRKRRPECDLPVGELDVSFIDDTSEIDCGCVLAQAEQLKPE
jgi:DNA-directed RNA polymerase specialized sigma24 family protein